MMQYKNKIVFKCIYNKLDFIESSIAVLKFGSRCTDSRAKGWEKKEKEGGGWETRLKVVCYFLRGVRAVFSTERQVDEMSNMFLSSVLFCLSTLWCASSTFYLSVCAFLLRFVLLFVRFFVRFQLLLFFFSPNQNKLEREKRSNGLTAH